MKKFLFSIALTSLLISCGKSIENEAKIVADFKCLAYNNHGDKRDEFEKEIDKITSKYSGEDRAKLEKLSEELFQKSCTEKIKEDKEMEAYEKEMNKLDETIEDESENIQNTYSNSSNNDFDKMLNDYEEYVDQYLVMYQKAMNGDQSAIMEYPALMENAQELEQSMKDAQNNNKLTVQQAKRMTDINFKMLEVMQKQGAGY